jgi:hypothetical protein
MLRPRVLRATRRGERIAALSDQARRGLELTLGLRESFARFAFAAFERLHEHSVAAIDRRALVGPDCTRKQRNDDQQGGGRTRRCGPEGLTSHCGRNALIAQPVFYYAHRRTGVD